MVEKGGGEAGKPRRRIMEGGRKGRGIKVRERDSKEDGIEEVSLWKRDSRRPLRKRNAFLKRINKK